ncbi:hypothetical protein ACHAXA_005251 [Cyclostephanos tholiformis]|uniref:Uncharacterized protein n=1 Tax=Cyclostephanos tholiformis TaxID=382380 RepID=A0ABD3R8N8_9STRA
MNTSFIAPLAGGRKGKKANKMKTNDGMVEYTRATSTLLLLVLLSTPPSSFTTTKRHPFAHAHEEDVDERREGEGGAWTYLDDVVLPTPLSDMGISTIPFIGINDTVSSSRAIVITGGCDSADGNELIVFDDGGEGFVCKSVSSRAYAFVPTRASHHEPWTGTFVNLPDMPRPRYRHVSAVVDVVVDVVVDGGDGGGGGGSTTGDGSGGTTAVLCVFGGRDELDGLVYEVDCYDPSMGTWIDAPTYLPSGRASSDLAGFAHPHLPGVVYLVGGYDESYRALDITTIVTMTTISSSGDMNATTTYAVGPALTGMRGDVDAAVVDGYAYVSGGFTHENEYETPMDTVERLLLESTTTNSTEDWKGVDALDQERGDKQLVGLDGRLYAMGGETKVNVTGVPESELPDLGSRSEILDTVEVFDPTVDDVVDGGGGVAEWHILAPMPGQLFRFGAVEWQDENNDLEEDDDDDDGYIFVFGGQVGYDGDCECFRTTDKVLVFNAHRALEHDEIEDVDGGATSAGTTAVVDAARAAFAVAVAGVFLLWIAS